MKQILTEESKLPWHAARVEAWRCGGHIAPITVDLAITRACSFRCEYCYGQLQKQPGERAWTKEMVLNTMDDFKHVGVRGVSFVSDGESTMSPYFWDGVIRAKQNGLDVAVGTNGWNLDYEGMEANLRKLTYLRFNISAATPERYCKIHGVREKDFDRVLQNIRDAVSIKSEQNLDVTIGLQMVFLPTYIDQVLPLAHLGKGLGVDYLQIKHCSDDEKGSLGVKYENYELCEGVLREAEALSTETYHVIVKWKKLQSGNKRCYSRCLAPPFQLQISGSGLVAPCFDGSTRFITNEGIKKISDLRKKTIDIFTPNGFKKANFWMSGVKEVVRIRLSNGASIITTPDHKIEVGGRWISASNTYNEQVDLLRGEGNWNGSNPLESDVDYIKAGFVFGDGFYHAGRGHHYVCIGKNDTDVEPLFRECKRSSSSQPYRRYIPQKSTLMKNLSILGIDMKMKSYDRVIPEPIFSLSPRAMSRFLCGLFSANGHVERKQRRIGFKTANASVAKDVQILLLALGVKNNLSVNKPQKIKWPNGEYTSKESYSLSITDQQSIEVFRSFIGFVQTYKKRILWGYKTKREARWKRLPTVIAIDRMPSTTYVYDFSVEDSSHCAWANGFVAHNCGMFFGPGYFRYHIGNLHEKRFIDILRSDRYWQVMDWLASSRFDAKRACGCLCLQDASNIWLNGLIEGAYDLEIPDEEPPMHKNFI